MATLKELATRTGYSMATISRILNNDPSMIASEETRIKILNAAGELNYALTKSRKGRSIKPILHIGIAEMLTSSEQLDDAYYLYLKSFVEQSCAKLRIALTPVLCAGIAPSVPLDGVIAIGIFTPAQQAALHRISDNITYLDSSPDEEHSDSVVINFKLGVSLAIKYLRALGHQRIGFIGPVIKYDDNKQPALERRRALFLSQMQTEPLFDEAYLINTQIDGADVEKLLRSGMALHPTPPTAFLTTSEPIALAALRALRNSGLAVPRDVSIISFNDTPVSALTDPPLTSISTHVQVMSETAVRLVAERAARRSAPPLRTVPQKVVIPPALIERKTTGAPMQELAAQEAEVPINE